MHDSRFDLQAGSYKQFTSPAQLAAGVDWASFVTPHAQKLRVGFRPTQVDAEVSITAVQSGFSNLHIQDRSVYVSDDDANYRTMIRTHVFSTLADEQALTRSGPSPHGSPRPTAIRTFALALDQFGFHIAWTYDNSPVNWELVVGQSEAKFLATLTALASKGYRPISVSSRRRNGGGEYAGIFVQDGTPAQDQLAMLGRTAVELTDESAAAARPPLWRRRPDDRQSQLRHVRPRVRAVVPRERLRGRHVHRGTMWARLDTVYIRFRQLRGRVRRVRPNLRAKRLRGTYGVAVWRAIWPRL